MAGNRGQAYPLSSTSRRRRRLALRHDPVTDSESVDAAIDPLVPHPPVSHCGLPSAPGEFDDQAAGDERITRVLAACDPRTWLIVGESFLPPSAEVRDWPGWIDRFTAQLRGPLGRRRDAVVDACCAGSTMAELRARLQTLSPPSSCDVVLLICGPADARAGVGGLPRFEEDLSAIVSRFAATGAAVIVSTPPVPWCGAAELHDFAHDLYAEAVRGCALERDLLLVDHRQMWESAAIPPGGAGSWFDGTPDRAGAVGHAQLARLLFEALWRCRPGPL